MNVSLDRWLDGELSHLVAKIPIHFLFLSNKEMNNEASVRVLGYNNTKLIKNSMISLTLEEDKLIWNKSSNVSFSIMSA